MILKGLFPVEVDANGLMAAFDELAAQTEARLASRAASIAPSRSPSGTT